MSPITHFLVGWAGLEGRQGADRDKALVVLAGLAPDLDGLGIIVDFATRMLGLPETDYYQMFHRMYGHALPAALAIAAVAAALAVHKVSVSVWAFVSVHLHFLCDVLGSRGSAPEDIWGIYYLAPFSKAWEIAWPGQWPLVSWQNMVITAVLLAVVMLRASKTGYSPLRLVSTRADTLAVSTLRQRLRWRAGNAPPD